MSAPPASSSDPAAVAVFQIYALPGMPSVAPGDDLPALIGAALERAGLDLRDGDILCVTSKIVSKALGLRAAGDRRAAVAGQTVRVVAERATATGITRIVEGRHGVVMAAAGVDDSNVGPEGETLLLPADPDAVTCDLHAEITAYLRSRLGAIPRFGVVLTDTAGRPWRAGQTDFALGAAGVRVLEDYRGRMDTDGRPLEVTAVAVADELAAAADLVKGKLNRVPVALVRGLGHLVADVPAGSQTGQVPGAARLVRTGPGDFFAMGHREAVRAALGAPPGSPAAEAAGIRPTGAQDVAPRLHRAVRVALGPAGESELGSAPEQRYVVTPLAPDRARVEIPAHGRDAFALGRLAARLEVALWSEDLSAAELRLGEWGEFDATAPGLTLTAIPTVD